MPYIIRNLFECPVCPKRFKTRKQLVYHLKKNGSEYFVGKV